MMKFKKGDRVRRVRFDNTDSVPIGSTGVVSSVPEMAAWGGWTMNVIWDHDRIRRNDFCISDNLELIEPPNTMNLTVTKDKVVEAASKCSTANQVLRVMFPEAFEPEKPDPISAKDIEIRDSGMQGHLNRSVGGSCSPSHLARKCLIVGRDYRVEMQEYDGDTILAFYTK